MLVSATTPVQKKGSEPILGVGAHPMTRQHRMLLDDVGCGLGHAPRARLLTPEAGKMRQPCGTSHRT
jgi:hypothetical protein